MKAGDVSYQIQYKRTGNRHVMKKIIQTNTVRPIMRELNKDHEGKNNL